MKEDSFDVDDFAQKLDNGISDVMPESWQGHARLLIRETDRVPEQIENKTIAKSLAIADRKGVPPKKAAEHLARHIAQKRAQKQND